MVRDQVYSSVYQILRPRPKTQSVKDEIIQNVQVQFTKSWDQDLKLWLSRLSGRGSPVQFTKSWDQDLKRICSWDYELSHFMFSLPNLETKT